MIDVEKIINVAEQAGKKILSVYQTDYQTWEKDDSSPVTEADLLSNEIIVRELGLLYPQIPVWSEESEEREKAYEYFYVDPLDGTKEFIKKNGEFTINICLMRDHKPIYGVIHVPAKGETYYNNDEGAFLKDSQTHSLPVTVYSNHKTKVLVSYSQEGKDFSENEKKVLSQLSDYETIARGSALKLCHIASGEADLYMRSIPCMEWDIAAGHAIIEAVGGQIIDDMTGAPMKYNKKDYKNGSFYCARKELVNLIS